MERLSQLLATLANGVVIAGAVGVALSAVVALFSGSLTAGLAVALAFSVALNVGLVLDRLLERNSRKAAVALETVRQTRADLDALRRALTTAMAKGDIDREGLDNDAARDAIEAATEAVGLSVQIHDHRLDELVAGWKRTFDATPRGYKHSDYRTGASDAEWQWLLDAHNAVLDHLGALTAGRPASPDRPPSA